MKDEEAKTTEGENMTEINRFRDRIIEVRKMKASELLGNDGNWRTHPALQRESLTGILREVGKTDVLLAYYSARQGNQLTLIDGHLRKDIDPDEVWTVAITDLNDDEADKMLLVLDPLAGMASADKEKMDVLLERVRTDDLGVREMLRRMEVENDALADEADETPKPENELPAMELMPFEHYDYLVLFFKTTFDFERALDFFGVRKTGWYAHMGGSYDKGRMKVGIGRALDGARSMERIAAATMKPRGENGNESNTANRDTEPQAGEIIDGTRADVVPERDSDGRRERDGRVSRRRGKRKSRAAS